MDFGMNTTNLFHEMGERGKEDKPGKGSKLCIYSYAVKLKIKSHLSIAFVVFVRFIS